MQEKEPVPKAPSAETMLEEVFKHNSSGRDARFVQFSANGVRLLSRTQIDDSYENIVIGEYNGLNDLYEVARAENERKELTQKTFKEGVYAEFSSDSDVQVIDTPFIEELDQFIKEGVSEQDIIDAAKETVAYREMAGLDEAILVCGLCSGGGCAWCNNEGSITKYPDITISNPDIGKRVTLDLNVAEMIARGDASVKKSVFSKAYSHGLVNYEEALYVLASESIRKQLSGMGLDSESTSMLVNGVIHSVNVLDFDLHVATNYWNRNGRTAYTDPDEITSGRKSHAMGGILGLSGGSRDYTAHELIFVAQHRISQFMGSVFNKESFEPKENWDIQIVPMKTIDESLKELCHMVNNRGYNLGYSNFWAISNNYVFLMQDEEGNAVETLEVSDYSFRMALENAKQKLVSKG